MANNENWIQFETYWHSAPDRLLSKVVGSTSRKTYNRQFAGYDVQAALETFSALTGAGAPQPGAYKPYDQRDERSAVMRMYSRMVLKVSGTEISKAEYERLMALYEAEFASGNPRPC